ncbi:MAG: radical SAM family heme chaperone HemW [Bacilli bacterium]|nr:radical SAM family heme chaperone HemW [Bacilli bacterium]
MNSVYIHIPFCKSICTYCDFCKQLYNETNIKKYLISLKEEITDRYNGEELDTLYIGGGTPSSLNMNQLKELFNIINILNLNNIKEFTFECNVNDITEELIIFLKENKVNRLSIGVESFNKDKLKFMERYSDFNDVKTKIEMIRNTGINNINIDLIYGIPNETINDLKKDLNLILKLKPDHISTYSLILEEYTKLTINNVKPIDEELELEMYNYIRKKLKSKKYIHYEISNFALSDKESIHNINYWNNEEYYGFGLSAHGYIDGIRYENTKNFNKYIENNFVAKQEIVGIKERMENELMLGFRKIKGINLEEFFNKYEVNIQEVFPVKPLLKNKDLIYKNGYIFINPDKLYIMNEILLKLI